MLYIDVFRADLAFHFTSLPPRDRLHDEGAGGVRALERVLSGKVGDGDAIEGNAVKNPGHFCISLGYVLVHRVASLGVCPQ